MIEENAKTLPVSLKPLLIGDGDLRLIGLVRDGSLVEPVHGLLEPAQVPCFQSILVDRLDHGYEQIADIENERLELAVEGIAPEVFVEVSYEVDKAFLLRAFDRVVTGIEVRDQDARVALQEFADNRSFSSLGHPEHNMHSICEDPNVVVVALNVQTCLVDVNERALEDSLDKHALRIGVLFGKGGHEIDDA